MNEIKELIRISDLVDKCGGTNFAEWMGLQLATPIINEIKKGQE